MGCVGALEFDGGIGEFAEGIKNAYVGTGAVGEFCLESCGVELEEERVEAQDGDMKSGWLTRSEFCSFTRAEAKSTRERISSSQVCSRSQS